MQSVPPPLPPVKEKKQDPVKEKLMLKFPVFEGSSTEELEKKKGKIEDKDPSCMSEAEGTGIVENPEIDKTDKSQCVRCERWIHNNQMKTHLVCHSSEILPWLFLGGEQSSYNIEELTKRTNISYILNVALDCKCYYPNLFTYKHVQIKDDASEDISEHFDDSFQFIDECRKQGKNILIHCALGMSRSATMVLMYLMRSEKMSLKEAYAFTIQRRHIIRPNPLFTLTLVKLDKHIYGAESIQSEEINPLSKFFKDRDTV